MFQALDQFFMKVGAVVVGGIVSIVSLVNPAPPAPVYNVTQVQQAPQIGAAIPTPVANFTTALASSIGASDTSMTLVSTSTRDGTSLVLNQLYGFTIEEGTSNEEHVVGYASSSQTITNMTRGVSVITGNTSITALKKAHKRGASVKITDAPVLLVVSRILNGDETVPNILQYSTSSATSTIQNNIYNIANVGYVNSVASSGVADATTVTAGKVEEATIAEINAKTQLGGTGARLFMTPEGFASSSYGLGSAFYGADTASNDTYTANLNVTLSGYATGTIVSILFNQPNTGAATLNLNSLGAKSILRQDGTALSDNDIHASTTMRLVYTAGSFRIISDPSQAPVGTIQMYASSTAPNGWLLANGQAVSRTTYAALFSLIGTQYGSGDGATTFTLPDFRSRQPVGVGQGSVSFSVATTSIDASGNTFTIGANSSTFMGTTFTVNSSGTLPGGLSSSTTYYAIINDATSIKLATSTTNANAGTAVDITTVGSSTLTMTHTFSNRTLAQNGGQEDHQQSTAEIAAHSHSIPTFGNSVPGSGGRVGSAGDNSAGSGTTSAAGSDTAMNVEDPFLAVNFIIRY